MRSTLPVATLAGAVLIVAAIAIGGVLAGRPGPIQEAAASPSTMPSAPPSAPPATGSPSASPVPSAPVVVVTPEPTAGPCDPADIVARITAWEGAAGSRIATIEAVNQGATTCLIEARDHPQLVDGQGTVLIDGRNPATTTVLAIAPGGKLTTLVSASNGCAQPSAPPVSVAFVLGDGRRIVAEALAPTDTTMPPCNGPGQPGEIDMHPWQPAP